MTRKTVIFIGVLLLAVAGILLFTATRTRDDRAPRPDVSPSRLLAPEAVKKLDRIQVSGHRYDHGAYVAETAVLTKRPDNTWQMTAPVQYSVNPLLVHEMLVTIADMTPTPISSETTSEIADRWELATPHGIAVTGYIGATVAVEFTVGASRGNATYLRISGRQGIFRTPGSVRRVFDRSPNQLRNRAITDFDAGSVTRLTFHGKEGPFTMVKSPEGPDTVYAPEGMAIDNFYVERAIHKAEALAHLHAKDFYDKPYRETDDVLRVTVTATQNGTPVETTLAFGGRDPDTGLHFVTSSLSKQVFLLSPHMKSLFTATPADFAQTDEQVEKRRAWREKTAAHARLHERRRAALKAQRDTSDDDHLVADTDLEDHIE